MDSNGNDIDILLGTPADPIEDAEACQKLCQQRIESHFPKNSELGQVFPSLSEFSDESSSFTYPPLLLLVLLSLVVTNFLNRLKAPFLKRMTQKTRHQTRQKIPAAANLQLIMSHRLSP